METNINNINIGMNENENIKKHKKDNENVLSFTIDHDYYEALIKKAKEAGMTISQYVKLKLLDNRIANETKMKIDKSKLDNKFPRVMLRLNDEEAKKYRKVIKGIKNKSHFIVAKCLELDEYISNYLMSIQKHTKYEWHTLDDDIIMP